jgi:competence protein ComEA
MTPFGDLDDLDHRDEGENSRRSRGNRDPLVRPQMKASLGQQVQASLLNLYERFRTSLTSPLNSRHERLEPNERMEPNTRLSESHVGRAGWSGGAGRLGIVTTACGGCLVAMLALGFFLGAQKKTGSTVPTPRIAAPGPGQTAAMVPLATLPLVGANPSPAPGTASNPVESVGRIGGGGGPGFANGFANGMANGMANGQVIPSGRPSVAPATIAVHAAGAVTNPAVYNLPAGARVDDVIHAAGGLRTDADTDAVNLAAHVGDGERVFVPRRGQPIPIVQTGTGQSVADSGALPTSGPTGVTGASGATGNPSPTKLIIDLNAATAADLDTLPGVGPATAEKIIDFRTRVGRFKSVSQLLEVPGIGDAKLAGLRSRVRV